jgi:hypothetical protein
MSDGWYYSRDGKSFGPFVLESLQQLAASGHLRLTDLLWRDGMREWKPAASVKELFQASRSKRRYSAPRARLASDGVSPVRVFLVGAILGLGLGVFLGVRVPWANVLDRASRDASEPSADLVSDQEQGEQGENGVAAEKRPASVNLTSRTKQAEQ